MGFIFFSFLLSLSLFLSHSLTLSAAMNTSRSNDGVGLVSLRRIEKCVRVHTDTRRTSMYDDDDNHCLCAPTCSARRLIRTTALSLPLCLDSSFFWQLHFGASNRSIDTCTHKLMCRQKEKGTRKNQIKLPWVKIFFELRVLRCFPRCAHQFSWYTIEWWYCWYISCLLARLSAHSGTGSSPIISHCYRRGHPKYRKEFPTIKYFAQRDIRWIPSFHWHDWHERRNRNVLKQKTGKAVAHTRDMQAADSADCERNRWPIYENVENNKNWIEVPSAAALWCCSAHTSITMYVILNYMCVNQNTI